VAAVGVTPPVYIHVGPPKTGTTFLQRRVFPNLADVFDVYNRAPSLTAEFRDRLVEENPLRVSLDALRGAVDAMLAACDRPKVLMSWEGLFGSPHVAFANNAHVAEGLKKIFPEARVILSVRRQDDYADSNYRQALHNYYSVSPARFLGWNPDGTFRRRVFTDHIPYPGIDVATLDWTPYIENYVRLFGRDNVKVLVYEDLRDDPAGYIRDLCAFTGSAPYVPPAITLENRGYSLLSCRVARGLNRFVHTPNNRLGIIPLRPFHDRLAARARGRDLWWALAGISRRIDLRWVLQNGLDRAVYVAGSPIPDPMRRGILAQHAEANRALDARYGLRLARHGYYGSSD
jgi:hypothetical protein